MNKRLLLTSMLILCISAQKADAKFCVPSIHNCMCTFVFPCPVIQPGAIAEVEKENVELTNKNTQTGSILSNFSDIFGALRSTLAGPMSPVPIPLALGSPLSGGPGIGNISQGIAGAGMQSISAGILGRAAQGSPLISQGLGALSGVVGQAFNNNSNEDMFDRVVERDQIDGAVTELSQNNGAESLTRAAGALSPPPSTGGQTLTSPSSTDVGQRMISPNGLADRFFRPGPSEYFANSQTMVGDAFETSGSENLDETNARTNALRDAVRDSALEAYARSIQTRQQIQQYFTLAERLAAEMDQDRDLGEAIKFNTRVRNYLWAQGVDLSEMTNIYLRLKSGSHLSSSNITNTAGAMTTRPSRENVFDKMAGSPGNTTGTGAEGWPGRVDSAGNPVPTPGDAAAGGAGGTGAGGAAGSGGQTGTAQGITAREGFQSRTGGPLVGSGHCVALVQASAPVGHTSTWAPGQAISPTNMPPPGTAIATFQDGRYANRTDGSSHAAIVVATDPQRGVRVQDQWVTGSGSGGVRERWIPWNDPSNSRPNASAANYSTIVNR